MNKLILILLFVLFGICPEIYGKTPSKISLIVRECREDESVCSTQRIVRLKFENGEYVGKETIIETDKITFSFSENRIYQNRFLITNWGDIIDLKDKKILHEGEGEFFRQDGGKIFIQVNRIDKDGLYVFDLKTKKYEIYKKTDDGMFFGELSPNGIRSAYWSCPIDLDCGIQIRSFGKEEIFIKGNFSVQVDKDISSSEMLDVPIFWLDDDIILTQMKNGELVTVHRNGQISPFLKIKLESEPNYNPKIYRGTDDKIYYWCGETFEIDIIKKKATRIDNNSRNDFIRVEDGVWKSFLYKNKSIGRFRSAGFLTTEGYLAVYYLEPNKFQGYYDGSQYWDEAGLKVWNDIKKDWIQIEIDWGVVLIGWIVD